MKCIHCDNEIKIRHAIETSLFSWPKRKTIWYVCPQCEQGNHIRFDIGLAQLIKLQGAPGYEQEVVSSVNESTIEIRVDPEYLHIWYMGSHYEIKERE